MQHVHVFFQDPIAREKSNSEHYDRGLCQSRETCHYVIAVAVVAAVVVAVVAVVVAVVVAAVVVAVVVAVVAVVVAAVAVVAVAVAGSLDNFSVTATGHWPLFFAVNNSNKQQQLKSYSAEQYPNWPYF